MLQKIDTVLLSPFVVRVWVWVQVQVLVQMSLYWDWFVWICPGQELCSFAPDLHVKVPGLWPSEPGQLLPGGNHDLELDQKLIAAHGRLMIQWCILI